MNYIIVPLECIRRQWQNSLQDTLHASDFIYDMCSVAILHKIEKNCKTINLHILTQEAGALVCHFWSVEGEVVDGKTSADEDNRERHLYGVVDDG